MYAHVRVLMTEKSCAVAIGMRNAKLGNHLNLGSSPLIRFVIYK